jgi:hypothetical protein
LTSSGIEWGANGHPFNGYGMPTAQQLQIVHDLGLTSYRVDLYDSSPGTVSALGNLIAQGKTLGISIMPILITNPGSFGDAGSAYQAALNMGKTYAKAFPGMTWELGNEFDVYSLNGGNGNLPSDYNNTKFALAEGVIKGLLDGIHSADPSSQGMIDQGWLHYGFLQRLANDGVKWDVTAEHWYSSMGDIQNAGGTGINVLDQLKAFGKPIEITEFGTDNGSGTSQATQANYITSVMNEWNGLAAKYNIKAGYIYELLDMNDGAPFGLTGSDGSMKAAGTAVKNFLATNPSTPGAANLAGGSTVTPTPTPTPTPSGSGPDTLALHVAGDAWNGNPHMTVTVDGKQIGAFDVTASHGAGQWQDVTLHGDFASAHNVQVSFDNDAYGGSATADRNLYVGSITLDGHTTLGNAGANTASNGMTAGSAAVLAANGSVTFDVTGQATPTPTPTPTPMSPSFSDGQGHDLFVFSAMTQAGSDIAHFDASGDIIDLAPLLKTIGYTGSDPFADHVVALAPSGTSDTAVMVDPHGTDAAHGTSLVTIHGVTPDHLPSADFWH